MRLEKPFTPPDPFFGEEPKTVWVAGRPRKIRWDLSAALEFARYVDTSSEDDETFLRRVLEIWYPCPPEEADEGLNAAICFYCGGKMPGEGYYRPFLPPRADPQKITDFFLRRYGIDLNREKVHWWTARRLLRHWSEGS